MMIIGIMIGVFIGILFIVGQVLDMVILSAIAGGLYLLSVSLLFISVFYSGGIRGIHSKY